MGYRNSAQLTSSHHSLSHGWGLCIHPLFICLASEFSCRPGSAPCLCFFLAAAGTQTAFCLLISAWSSFSFLGCSSPNPYFFFALSKSTPTPLVPGFDRNLLWSIKMLSHNARVPPSASEALLLLLQGMLPAEISTGMALCRRKWPCPWLRLWTLGAGSPHSMAGWCKAAKAPQLFRQPVRGQTALELPKTLLRASVAITSQFSFSAQSCCLLPTDPSLSLFLGEPDQW